jgi:ribosome-associated protein
MEPKSKSQVKRDMTALQSLGEKLVKLGPDQLKKIDLGADLLEAVLHARSLRRGEARRRQIQYIGVLMRDVDPEPIREALEEISSGRGQDARLFQKLERWREALIEGNDETLTQILAEHPNADRRRLLRFALNARKEREASGPPKSSRGLFRYLRGLAETTDAGDSKDSTDSEDSADCADFNGPNV